MWQQLQQLEQQLLVFFESTRDRLSGQDALMVQSWWICVDKRANSHWQLAVGRKNQFPITLPKKSNSQH
jgi:hypothetical protein